MAGRHRLEAGIQELAYDASGVLRWEARKRTVTPRGDLEMAVDSARRRIHLLNEPGIIQYFQEPGQRVTAMRP